LFPCQIGNKNISVHQQKSGKADAAVLIHVISCGMSGDMLFHWLVDCCGDICGGLLLGAVSF